MRLFFDCPECLGLQPCRILTYEAHHPDCPVEDVDGPLVGCYGCEGVWELVLIEESPNGVIG